MRVAGQASRFNVRTNNDPPEAVLKNAVVSLSTSEMIVLLTDLSEKPTPIYIATDFSEVLLLLNTTQKISFQLCVDNKPISYLSGYGLSGSLPDFSSMDALQTM